MKYIVTINKKNYEVEVERGQANIIAITETAAAAVMQAAPSPSLQPAAVSVQNAPAAVQNAAGEALKAPMPGTILAIKTSIGSQVKKGDTLFILEAMKMENEITAPKDGVVTQIAATKGLSVSTGDLLAVIQ